MNIEKLGSAFCEYTGGGIYVAYMPVEINGKSIDEEEWRLYLSYDSESLLNDEGAAEFAAVWVHPHGYEEMADLFNGNGWLILENNSPYIPLYEELKNALMDEMSKSLTYAPLIEEMRKAETN